MPGAADIYRRIDQGMTELGYTRWRETLSFREVPADKAEGLFQIIPASTDPQSLSFGARCIDTRRVFRVIVLYRVKGDVPFVMQDRVLPEEDRIVDWLLSFDFSESVSTSYADTDEGGGFITLSLELSTRYDRQIPQIT